MWSRLTKRPFFVKVPRNDNFLLGDNIPLSSNNPAMRQDFFSQRTVRLSIGFELVCND